MKDIKYFINKHLIEQKKNERMKEREREREREGDTLEEQNIQL